MAKISQKELEYLKQNMSSEQILDLVSIKAKMNKRQIKLGKKINESVSDKEVDMSGFMNFLDILDPQSKNKFESIFSIFQGEETGTPIQEKVYEAFQLFLSSTDEYFADFAE